MHVNVCKHCFKVFRSVAPRGFCDDCKEEDMTEFDRIEEYLKKYPNSNALQIAESLEIDVYNIIKYMEEGRLIISQGRFDRLED